MADLSQLSDEQLQVYREMLVKKQGASTPATPPVAKPEGEQPATPGGVIRALPGAALDLGKGALKGIASGAYDLLGRPGDAHAPSVPGGFERTRPSALTNRIDRTTKPSNTAQAMGSYIPTIASLAMPTKAASDVLIPNLERAGGNFQTVMKAARNVPLDLSKASEPALEAHSLSEAGATMPKIMNKFLQRTTSPGSEPLTYEQGRRFASNAGRLSTQESMNANPMMKRQVSALAGALRDANESAAEQAGVGDLYRDAMREYRHGMALRGVKDSAGEIAKSTAMKYALGGAAGGAAAYGVRKALGD